MNNRAFLMLAAFLICENAFLVLLAMKLLYSLGACHI
jgi:hypothetical protein